MNQPRNAVRHLVAPCWITAALALAAGCGGASPETSKPPRPSAQEDPPSSLLDRTAGSGAAADDGGSARASRAAPPYPRGFARRGEGAPSDREAQRAWCSYLEALYQRAAGDTARWPRYQHCIHVSTLAAPGMLHAAAECSLEALQQFVGDPFTPAYAAEVSRCATQAMSMTAASRRDLAPIRAVLCERVEACERIDRATCEERLDAGPGRELTRAIGAMNSRGHAQLSACLSEAPCQDLSAQIVACISPIMEDLFWLPD